MKILVLCDEVWNDNVHANNVLSNWFSDFPAEFANVYCSSGQPLNSCCKKYFQITDSMMAKSILTGNKAGNVINFNEYPVIETDTSLGETPNVGLYSFLKSISCESIRLLREIIWNLGKYDIEKLKQFIDDFSPDIIFSGRMATKKIVRLENIIHSLTDVPFVAFTGDDEYSLQQFRLSPIFWIKRFWVRQSLAKMFKNYSLYYTLSQEQLDYYKEKFNCNIKILMKCGNFENDFPIKPVNKVIKLVYAGRLYCNRWKTLAKIGQALKEINKDDVKMVLEIFTKDKISKKQKTLLHDDKNIFLMGSVSGEQLKQIYNKADIAIHTESFDLKNKLITRFSFSTKIIDCLQSSCAIMAVCWNKHSAYTYLKSEDAAICIDDLKKIKINLERIIDNKNIIAEYRKKAWECGKRNHQKQTVQEKLSNDFKELLK